MQTCTSIALKQVVAYYLMNLGRFREKVYLIYIEPTYINRFRVHYELVQLLRTCVLVAERVETQVWIKQRVGVANGEVASFPLPLKMLVPIEILVHTHLRDIIILVHLRVQVHDNVHKCVLRIMGLLHTQVFMWAVAPEDKCHIFHFKFCYRPAKFFQNIVLECHQLTSLIMALCETCFLADLAAP